MHINGKKVVSIPNKNDPLEKVIERTVKAYAKSKGFYVRKFNSEGRRSVPDALLINLYGQVFFMEFKRLGKKPTKNQLLEHVNIKKNGIHTYIVDNIDAGKSILDQMVDYRPQLEGYTHAGADKLPGWY